MESETLRQIGMAESEIKVYYALLELESSTVGPIVKRAGIQDSKIYSVLEKLKSKGLASYVIKNNVKHFQASNPRKLLKIITEKEQQLKKQKNELKTSIIPDIERKRLMKEDRQEATVYEGYEGFRAALYSILDSLGKGEEYCVFMLGSDLDSDRLVRFFRSFHSYRESRGIKVRLLSHRRFREMILRKHKNKGMNTRFTDQEIPVGTFIYKGHVTTVVWGEKPAAFCIKSKKNYKYYKNFFEYVWKSAKK